MGQNIFCFIILFYFFIIIIFFSSLIINHNTTKGNREENNIIINIINNKFFINNNKKQQHYGTTNELERKKEVEAVSLSDVINNKGFNRKKNGALKKGVWGVRFVVVNYADLIGHGGKRVGVVKARELVFS